MHPSIENHKNHRTSITIFFVCSLFLMFSVFFLFFYDNPKGSQANVFFDKANDYMADYYNVAKHSAERDPYFSTFQGSYPPLPYVIFKILSKFAPYSKLDSFIAGKTNLGLATSAYFMFVISVLFFLQLLSHSKGEKGYSFFLVVSLVLSGIFIFAYERGNIVILSVMFTTFYLFNYDSPHTYIKKLAFVSLALAASLKIFPALFGILLIYDRKYKDAFRLVVYGIVFFIFPFIFMKGSFSNIFQFVRNLFTANDSYLYVNAPRFGHYYFLALWSRSGILMNLFPRETLNIFFTIVVFLFSGISLWSNRCEQIQWKRIALITIVMLILPSISFLYNGLYLFPVMIMFFNQPILTKKDWVYAILFLLILNPIQIPVWKANLNTVFINFSVLYLALDIFVGQCYQRCKYKQNKRLEINQIE